MWQMLIDSIRALISSIFVLFIQVFCWGLSKYHYEMSEGIDHFIYSNTNIILLISVTYFIGFSISVVLVRKLLTDCEPRNIQINGTFSLYFHAIFLISSTSYLIQQVVTEGPGAIGESLLVVSIFFWSMIMAYFSRK